MYEPLFRLNFGQYLHLNSSQYSCIKQNVSIGSLPVNFASAWDLDQLDSSNQNNLYYHPSFAFDNGVDLYVVDSGVLASHNEFYTGQVIHKQGDGPTTYEYNSTVTWYASHGTHVSGSFGGKHYGVTKNLTIYDYRVCEFSPYSDYWTPSDSFDYPCPFNLIIKGLEGVNKQLSTNGRRGVINLSLGGTRSDISVIYDYYFDLIVQNNGIVVVAAGNSDLNACNDAPAYSDYCIAVGAMNSTLQKAWFSNYGDCVDIWGPGVDIWSSVADCDECYASYDGTSMASPHIAGVVASYLWINPNLNYSDIRSILQYNTTTITGGECDSYTCKFPFINHCSHTPTYEQLNWTEIDNDNSAKGFGIYNNISKTQGNFIAIIDVDITTLTATGVTYHATNKCEISLNDPTDYLSYTYICDDILNNTAYLYYYTEKNCTGSNRTLIKTIKTGDIDGDQSYYVQCLNQTKIGYNNGIGLKFQYAKYYSVKGKKTICNFSSGYVESYDQVYLVKDVCYWAQNGTNIYSYSYSCTNKTLTSTYYEGKDCSGTSSSSDQTVGCYQEYGYYFDIIECPSKKVATPKPTMQPTIRPTMEPTIQLTPTPTNGGFTTYYINNVLIWILILVAAIFIIV